MAQQSDGYGHKDVIEATVVAAKSIAMSCIKVGTVRRLIYTASVMAVSPLKDDGTCCKDFMDETCWTPLYHSDVLYNNNSIMVFDNNNLSGSIPTTLGLVRILVMVRLDWNSFSGPVLENFSNLGNVTVNVLNLSNNNLTRSIPHLSGMNFLTYVVLSNNRLSGTLDIGTSYVRNMTLDLQNNSISDLSQRTG